ncbi:DUF1801 domain-containing protein [Paraflavitalea speifideaquila]|uniref:DUF1801 domain-containing protein n=1 Tax=Paraflavitalea speifideaquila TaxID=3076558 RepID=UPI0028E50F1A|nr:DUF1801 domain-containing protein [Paraflavitalea speifideiaquila]
MAKTKTTATGKSVKEFITAVDNETKRDESFQLIEIFKTLTGVEPYMWGPTIVGFDNYHYKYESGHEGDAPLAAFSPRKDAFVIYLAPTFEGKDELLQQLGKHKMGKGCLYVKKLMDIDIEVLKKVIVQSMKDTRKLYP